MLEELDLHLKMEKEEWNACKEMLWRRLSVLQQRARELKIPTIILFEGWGASGKGLMISRLIQNLDPRGFSVHNIVGPTAEDLRYPWMYRFWKRLPLYGEIAIFDRSWYYGVTAERESGELSGKEIERRFDEIVDFERQMVDDGAVLLKFFLHVSRKEQRRRLKGLESKKATRWRVTQEDWRRNRHYEEEAELFEEMLERTSKLDLPWTLVEAEDKRYAVHKVLAAVISALEGAIARRESDNMPEFAGVRISKELASRPLPPLSEVSLARRTLSIEEYKQELKRCQKQLFELQNRLYQKRIPLILAFEGWDAAGKGGTIKRVTQALDPRGYEVIPICAPSPVEKNHQHLWRFWNALPRDGHTAIFDRTWYGRVLVEHIEGFCTMEQWGRAYDEINRFERRLADWGAIVLKFWLQIDQEEQLRRFIERQRIPEKQYKITDEDWRNRDKWDQYEEAVNEMLARTNTGYAPWTVVESNDKRYGRIKTMKTIIHAAEERLK